MDSAPLHAHPAPDASATAWSELIAFFDGPWFMPHGHCYLWKPGLVGLHTVSDTLIGAAYFGISLLLYLMVRRVRLPFSPMILAFGVFIGACGMTHLVEVWNVWHGAYWFAGSVKAVTALASVATAMFLVPIRPRVVALAEQAVLAEDQRLELQRKNDELERLYSYRALAEVMPQIVWTTTPDGRVDYWNQRWVEYTGLTTSQVQASGVPPEVLHPDDLQPTREQWRVCVERGERFEFEYRVRRASDGAYRWHLARAEPVRDASGTLVKWFGTSTDIHDSKLREQEATRLAEFHERLVGIVSHDVRSPVTAILATTGHWLHDPSPDERQRKAIERVHRSATRITKLIDVLLDYTRARVGGGIPLSVHPTHLHELCRKGAEELESAAPGRQVQLSLGGPPDGLWDSVRLGQVVSNLLENAFKYGDDPRAVTLRTSGDATHAVLEVHNWGAPIPSDVLPSLFEPFRRGHPHEGTVQLSLGLGLYIVREVVLSHGGSVDVHSTAESGTTFRVVLPRTPGNTARAPFS